MNLRIGIPSKGRLAELAAELLVEAGLKFRRQERSLFARVRDMPIDVTFLRTDDIPVLCAEGAIDLGITGSDLVEESGVELANAAVARDSAIAGWRSACRTTATSRSPPTSPAARIATSFPACHAKRISPSTKSPAHIVQLTGSVEVMIALGVADAIVDLVETGSTLAANRLRILDEIGQYETVLVQNPATKHGAALRPRRPPARRRRHRPQLLAAGIQRAGGQAGRGGKDHARLRIADDQQARRSTAGSPSARWSSAAK